ncbi:MAG: cation diffusion facilitator family transporter [Euryarchaeota archaeon]|nr:cation diffusion facilitator family transporter [Euryarchaeota archaeon]
MSDARRNAKKLRAASFSILVNVFLLSLKLVVRVVTGSLGILAEAAHSLLDLIASGFAYLGVKGASIPAHEDRPYGHEKYENFSSLIQTVLLGITSIWILYEAGQRLLNGFSLEVGNALYYDAMAVMVIAVVADLYVSRYLFRNARAFGSSALEADAYHFSTDMYSSAAVLVGFAAAKLGYVFIDPLAAIVVAVIMLSTSIRLFQRTTRILLDAAPPKEMTTHIAEVICNDPHVTYYHDLRARQAGSSLFVDVSIHVKPDLSLEDAHGIAPDLESAIKKRVPNVKDSVIHIEPEI